MSYCFRCNKSHRLGCPQSGTWDVWPAGEDRGEYQPAHADTAEEAVETWVEERESGDCDYPIASGSSESFCVAKVGSDKVERFEVFGEFEPTYRAVETTGMKTEGT